MELYLTYGVHKVNGKLLSVNEAERGLSCNCVCPECGGDLVKKDRGEFGKRRAHFAHYRNSEFCTEEKAYESALHKLGKQIILESKAIFLPEYSGSPNFKRITLPSKKIQFESVEVEKRSNDLIPDIVGTIEGYQLWIELVNTHYIDAINSDKLVKIRERGIECIEIELKGQDLDTLKEFLLSSNKNRYWINSPINYLEAQELYNKKLKEHKEEAEKERKEKEERLSNLKKRIDEWKKEGCMEFKITPGYVRPFQCPKSKKAYEDIRKGTLYTHPIIRDIVDRKKDEYGIPYSNGAIYGRISSYIYYMGAKYRIYDNPREQKPALLWAGLKKIEEIRTITCYECEYNMLNTANFPSEIIDGISVCSLKVTDRI